MGDPHRPSGNRLVLHDHAERPLAVRDLARLRLPGVRLAHLSACDTPRTTPELADEAVHAAVRTPRADYPMTPSLWACQVHLGP
ncbi:CHAT domain-containing protein [Streptomyces sp. NPDC127098]|uniref:CHAT domain-containing protein n=1 Tax=Streptomyces sp. NPDC127098 TaxID=3347137 RepID=UPI0036670CA0